ncbi:sulfur carrier protein ThiS adenylyltransferase ThiF [Megamonas funiformis]
MADILAKELIYQTLNDRHGIVNQEKLNNAKVAIAGLGGLGSNIAVALARIGVSHLHLIDFDKVDISNLNRQHYFISHLNKYKTQALAEQLQMINPYLNIVTDCIKVTEDNIFSLFKDEDIICEAFDVPENKAMLVNKVLEFFPEKYIISGSGMAGFGHSNEIHTRKVMGKFYICGDEKTALSNENSLMAPRVAICAGHQANLITQLILENNL